MFSLFTLAATAAAFNVSTSTEVVTAYTTYCPSATTFVEGASTYTALGPTNITVTDCPCTRTHTFSTATVTVCPTSSGVALAGPESANTTVPALANSANKHGISMAAAVGAVVLANLL